MAGKIIGADQRPLICTPLVGTSEAQLLEQLLQVLEKAPDIIEWRADFFDALDDTSAVLKAAGAIKKAAGDTPVLFTIRSQQEGGQPIKLSDQEVLELDAEICSNTTIEYVDVELRNAAEAIQTLRDVARKNNKKLVGSFHNFHFTPSYEEILAKLTEAKTKGLDVAKVAVMPQKLEDVLTVLSATLAAKQKLQMPLITMSMGKFGAISRIIGGVFGSSLSFAVGAKASAPGQVPIEDLKAALDIIDRAMMGE